MTADQLMNAVSEVMWLRQLARRARADYEQKLDQLQELVLEERAKQLMEESRNGSEVRTNGQTNQER